MANHQDPIIINEEETKKKGSKWIFLLFLILFLIVISSVYYFYRTNEEKNKLQNILDPDTTEFFEDTSLFTEPVYEDTISNDTLIISGKDTLEQLSKSDTNLFVEPEEKFVEEDKIKDSSNKEIFKDVKENDNAGSKSLDSKKHKMKWYGIVNTFRGLYFAEKQVASLKKMGFPAFYKKITVTNSGSKNGIWYKVYAGPFSSYNGALTAKRRILKSSYVDNVYIIQSKK